MPRRGKKGGRPNKKGAPSRKSLSPAGGWRFSGSSRASCRHLHAAISGVSAPGNFNPIKKTGYLYSAACHSAVSSCFSLARIHAMPPHCPELFHCIYRTIRIVFARNPFNRFFFPANFFLWDSHNLFKRHSNHRHSISPLLPS